MSTPASPFEDMMRAAEDMAKAMQQSFGAFGAPQGDAAWPTMSKDWMELLFGNAINTGGLDAKTKLLLTLAGLNETRREQAPTPAPAVFGATPERAPIPTQEPARLTESRSPA